MTFPKDQARRRNGKQQAWDPEYNVAVAGEILPSPQQGIIERPAQFIQTPVYQLRESGLYRERRTEVFVQPKRCPKS